MVANLSGLQGHELVASKEYSDLIDVVRECIDLEDCHGHHGVQAAIGKVALLTPEHIAIRKNDRSLFPLLQIAQSLFQIPRADRSAKHEELLQSIEVLASDKLRDYGQFLVAYAKQNNTVEPQQMAKLLTLLDSWNYTHENILRLIATHAAIEQLPDLIEQYPYLVIDPEARNTIVRRLARAGMVSKAIALAQNNTIPFREDLEWYETNYQPILNLYAVYQETGDEHALVAADKLFNAYQVKRCHLPDVMPMLIAERMKGVYLHSDEYEMVNTYSTMDQQYASGDFKRRTYALAATIRMFIEIGEVEIAEIYAHQIADDYNQNIARDHGPRAINLVVAAYLAIDRRDDAERLALRYLQGNRLINQDVLGIIATLNSNASSPLPKLLPLL